MAFMVGYQSFLLYKVGTGAWDFSKYQWLLPSLLVQNLAQIVGLAVFVVKALFKDMNWKSIIKILLANALSRKRAAMLNELP
jgi:hypothetical protein